MKDVKEKFKDVAVIEPTLITGGGAPYYLGRGRKGSAGGGDSSGGSGSVDCASGRR